MTLMSYSFGLHGEKPLDGERGCSGARGSSGPCVADIP